MADRIEYTFKPAWRPMWPEHQPKPEMDERVTAKVAEIKARMMADIEASLLGRMRAGELVTPHEMSKAVHDAYLAAIIDVRVDEDDPTRIHFTMQLPKGGA